MLLLSLLFLLLSLLPHSNSSPNSFSSDSSPSYIYTDRFSDGSLFFAFNLDPSGDSFYFNLINPTSNSIDLKFQRTGKGEAYAPDFIIVDDLIYFAYRKSDNKLYYEIYDKTLTLQVGKEVIVKKETSQVDTIMTSRFQPLFSLFIYNKVNKLVSLGIAGLIYSTHVQGAAIFSGLVLANSVLIPLLPIAEISKKENVDAFDVIYFKTVEWPYVLFQYEDQVNSRLLCGIHNNWNPFDIAKVYLFDNSVASNAYHKNCTSHAISTDPIYRHLITWTNEKGEIYARSLTTKDGFDTPPLLLDPSSNSPTHIAILEANQAVIFYRNSKKKLAYKLFSASLLPNSPLSNEILVDNLEPAVFSVVTGGQNKFQIFWSRKNDAASQIYKISLDTTIKVIDCSTLNENDICTACVNNKFPNAAGTFCLDPISHCSQYNDNGGCTLCEAGYFGSVDSLSCFKTIEGCLQYRNKGVCEKCIEGNHLLANGLCQAPIVNCLNYNADWTECTKCDNGFVLAQNNAKCFNIIPFCESYLEDGLCSACSDGKMLAQNKNLCFETITDCITYSNDGKCQTCIQTKTPIADNSLCVSTIANCLTYLNDGVCSSCIGEKMLSQNKNLCFDKITDCITYSNEGKCQACIQTKTPIADNNICGLIIKNCITYSSDGLCSVCSTGKTLASNNNLCFDTVSDCATYTNDGKCQTCVPTKILIANKNSCALIIKDCLSYSSDGRCETCVGSKILIANGGLCTSIISDCISYSNDGKCLSCISSKIPIVSATICGTTIADCASYSNEGKCMSCISPQIVASDGSRCFSPISSCLSYSNEGVCFTCSPPLTPTGSFPSACIESIYYVKDCGEYDAKGTCLTCGNGKQLSFNGLKCVEFIYGCSLYEITGECKKCVGYLELATNKKNCVAKINRCLSYSSQGLCSSCDSSYLSSNQKSCLTPIVNCLSHEEEGKCAKCVSGTIWYQEECIENGEDDNNTLFNMLYFNFIKDENMVLSNSEKGECILLKKGVENNDTVFRFSLNNSFLPDFDMELNSTNVSLSFIFDGDFQLISIPLQKIVKIEENYTIDMEMPTSQLISNMTYNLKMSLIFKKKLGGQAGSAYPEFFIIDYNMKTPLFLGSSNEISFFLEKLKKNEGESDNFDEQTFAIAFSICLGSIIIGFGIFLHIRKRKFQRKKENTNKTESKVQEKDNKTNEIESPTSPKFIRVSDIDGSPHKSSEMDDEIIMNVD